MNLAANLRAEAREADERRVLVLAGDADATRERAADALDGADVAATDATLIGQGDWLDCQRIEPRAARTLLGETRQAVVVDCHDECRPNALGAAVGAVDGGGLLVLLAPPLARWPNIRDDFDATLAVPPFERDQVISYFRRRLVWTLRQHRGVALVEVDDGGAGTGEFGQSGVAEGCDSEGCTEGDEILRDGHVEPAPRLPRHDPTPPADAAFPRPAYEACLTADQADAVAALEALRESGRAVVVESDRGRGKSSAAGLAAAALALEGTDVLVTAPAYRNAAAVFERAEALLTDIGELAGRDRPEDPRVVATETGRVRFAAADEARTLPEDPDVVIVDEAAALPVRVLAAFLDAPAVAFATTVHGYEGAGRGFAVRFRDRLAESDFEVTEIALADPIRYAPGDPVEVWAARALCLGASPAVEPLVADATPKTTAYRRFSSADLLDDEHALREVFGLLVLAHYRTEPNDLARLLDAPNVTTRALLYDGHVVAVALLAREGGLSEERRARMYAGERVTGNMLPDVLTSQLRDEDAGAPVGQRVLRLAVHPAARRRGLGSRLLADVRAEFANRVDWLGVGYGMTSGLVDFWRTNGFATVHLSTTRNETSGEHSAIMLDPLSDPGADLLERHTDWCLERLPAMLGDPLSDLDPDVVRAALRSIDGEPAFDLSRWEWRIVAGLTAGAAIFDTAPRPFRRLALHHLVAPARDARDTISAREERLLVEKALQARSWGTVADDLGYHSHSTCMRAFGDVVGALVDAYGTAFARDERRRLE
ncbi:MAG: tRNA(Met) cytidine acetyltransferase TmcA [Haloarculaceae archaeon]